MEDIKAKRLAVLTDTIAHFTKKNRSVFYAVESYSGASCRYAPIEGRSNGCAIGRLIEDKALCVELDNLGSVNQSEVFEKLPNHLKELGQDFLGKLQQLHDNDYNWDDTGLTDQGRDKVKDINTVFID